VGSTQKWRRMTGLNGFPLRIEYSLLCLLVHLSLNGKALSYTSILMQPVFKCLLDPQSWDMRQIWTYFCRDRDLSSASEPSARLQTWNSKVPLSCTWIRNSSECYHLVQQNSERPDVRLGAEFTRKSSLRGRPLYRKLGRCTNIKPNTRSVNSTAVKNCMFVNAAP